MTDILPSSHRRWWIVAALLLALAVAIGLCEAAGWPFLVAPMQRWLTHTLDRRIAFGGDGSGVRIGLVGSVRVQAASLEIGAPTWSSAPHMVRAANAQLKLGYGDLWRAWRGEPLHIRELRAERLDARIERLADGRASWQFGPPKMAEPTQPARLPSFGELRVGDGTVLLRDAVLEADLDARFSLTERSAAAMPTLASASASASASAVESPLKVEPRGGLQLHAVGTYRNQPLKVDLSTAGVLETVGPDAAQYTQPVRLDATIGRATVHFSGTAADALHLGRVRGRFDVAGPSLAAIGDPLGVTLPTTAPFRTHGSLVKRGDLWQAVFDDAAIGESRLNGTFTYDRSRKIPLLSGRLGGARLVLADLGPVVGAPARHAAPGAPPPAPAAPKSAKVLPDRRFDLPSLRAMDADVLFDIAYLDLGTSLLEPLKPLRTHLRLQGGVLTLSDIDARTAEGRLSGELGLDGRGTAALWTADLRLLGVRLERWLHLARKNGAPPYISGRMDGQVKVSGAGRSTAEILGSLNGSMRFHLRDATVSHLAIEAAGIDPAQALGVFFKGDDALAIACNVADLAVDKGVATPRVFVIDTRDSTVWITGSLSLRSEALDLTGVVSPKDFSPLTLRTPIRVKGTFSAPSVSLDKGTIGAKVGAAALLALLNPRSAVIPFIDPGAGDDARREAAQCSELARRGHLSTVAPRAPVAARAAAPK